MKAATDQPGCWHLKSCWGILLQHSHSRSSLCTLLCPLPPTLQHPEICYCFAHRKKTQRMTLAQRRFQSLSFRNMTNTLGHVLGTCRPTPPELGQHRAPTGVPSTSHTPMCPAQFARQALSQTPPCAESSRAVRASTGTRTHQGTASDTCSASPP